MNEHDEMTREDREVVELVARGMDGPELSPAQQVEFDLGLQRRIARRRRRPWVSLAFALPTAAALVALAVLPGTSTDIDPQGGTDWLAFIDATNEVVYGSDELATGDGYDWLYGDDNENQNDSQAESAMDIELDAYSAEYQAIALWLSPTEESDNTNP